MHTTAERYSAEPAAAHCPICERPMSRPYGCERPRCLVCHRIPRPVRVTPCEAIRITGRDGSCHVYLTAREGQLVALSAGHAIVRHDGDEYLIQRNEVWEEDGATPVSG